METEMVQPKVFKFICNYCNYKTNRNGQYDRHLLTTKHLARTKTDNNVPLNKCNCGKIYKTRQGLWKHKQKCSQQSEDRLSILIEQNKQILEQIDRMREQLNTHTSIFIRCLRPLQ